jgi:tRNA(Ile)-lysidine synthase
MLLARVRRTLRERRLVRRGDRVVVAVSGGPDSTAMLDVLARLAPELELSIVAACVDHGLRASAGGELALARAQAARLGVPFHALRVEVAPRGSLQAAARAARYEALRSLAAACDARRIAVGHTRDDQAETVLARLLRGSGPRGLAGIAPRRADGVIRPLIDATREQVRLWNDAHGLVAAEDPSNVDPRFQRSRIRHDLLPALEAESPALRAHLARVADDSRALAGLARREAARLLRRAARPDGGLDAPALGRALAAARREALRAWGEATTGRNLRRAHLDAMESALQGRGYARLPGGWSVRLEDATLVARRALDEEA